VSRWYYTLDNRQRLGPVTAEQLRHLARSGAIRPDHMVMPEGGGKWLPAAQILVPAESGPPPPPAPYKATPTGSAPQPPVPVARPVARPPAAGADPVQRAGPPGHAARPTPRLTPAEAAEPAGGAPVGRRFYVRDESGRVSGPFGSATLRRLAREGKLSPSWHLSPDGKRWTAAAKAQRLFPDLENALADHLKANSQDQTRELNRKEQIGFFIDQFVLNNDQLKDSFLEPLLQPVRVAWARLTLPRSYLTAEVTPAGTRWVRHDLATGENMEIDQKEADRRMSKGIKRFDWFKLAAAAVVLLWLVWSFKDFTFDWHPTWGTLKTVLLAGLTFAGFIYKLKQTRVFVGYVVDPAVEKGLESIKEAFLALRRCSRVWVFQVYQSQDAGDWKYNAGSLISVARLPVAVFNRPIPNVETNLRVSGIAYGRRALYFLPDKLLVIDGGRVGHVAYQDLVVTTATLDYVEQEGHVYGDSAVIEHRWKYINRDGSRDRRFKANYELPVVRCGILRLDAGEARLKLLITDPGAPEVFRGCIRAAT
jgi:hypothetical protein